MLPEKERQEKELDVISRVQDTSIRTTALLRMQTALLIEVLAELREHRFSGPVVSEDTKEKGPEENPH